MKVRIGVSVGVGATTDVGVLGQLVDDLDELDFDSLWLPEVLTVPALDPLVALAFAAAHNPRLKLGTTMLLPGRNPVRLAKELATLDMLSGGRLLVTFVPGLPRSPEAEAVGVPKGEKDAHGRGDAASPPAVERGTGVPSR
jgi:alkanesulfonate monooxygenase SsuD/methylene tetrahydromethanopterin reductase-like flavin-dependent oxidoreductase (luciferase family)